MGIDISHMYEWASESGSRDEIDATPKGRLWHIPKGGMAGANFSANVIFRKSSVLVPLEGPTNIPRARHLWEDKAFEQEFMPQFTVEAGGPAKTRVSEGVSTYLYITQYTPPLFRKRRTNQNPYYGNFRKFFESYWSMHGEAELEKELSAKLEKEFRPEIESMVNERLRRARRMPAGAGVAMPAAAMSVRVKGKPMSAGGLNTSAPREVVSRTRRIMKRITRGRK